MTRASIVLLIAVVSLAGAGAAQTESPQPVRAEMQNVQYHFTDTISVHISQLNGRLVPLKQIVVFDDKESFILEIDAAVMSMSPDALTHILNDHVFTGKDSPLKDLVVSTDSNQLKIKGKLAKKGDIPFEMSGEIQATEDGKIRLHAKHIKAAHLPVKGIMDLFGVEVANLVNTKKVNGVTTDKDDVILDPEQILPPPRIRGKLSSIRVENGQIIQVFGKERPKITVKDARNFMAYRGGTLRFGKLTMSDTDLKLIDSDPRDPFDFYLDHYKDQLMAGYSKTTSTFGLRTYMVDFSKLAAAGKTTSAQGASPSRKNASLAKR